MRCAQGADGPQRGFRRRAVSCTHRCAASSKWSHPAHRPPVFRQHPSRTRRAASVRQPAGTHPRSAGMRADSHPEAHEHCGRSWRRACVSNLCRARTDPLTRASPTNRARVSSLRPAWLPLAEIHDQLGGPPRWLEERFWPATETLRKSVRMPVVDGQLFGPGRPSRRWVRAAFSGPRRRPRPRIQSPVPPGPARPRACSPEGGLRPRTVRALRGVRAAFPC